MSDALYVVEAGDGPPILLISGAGGDADPFLPLIQACAGTRRAIAYDRRGNSRSGRPPLRAGVSGIAAQADDAAAVLDQLGVERASVLGTSGGGCIALELARRHPERVDHLILHDPALVHALPEGDQMHADLGRKLAADRRELGAEGTLEGFLRHAYGDAEWERMPQEVTRRTAANGAVFLDEEYDALTGTRPPAPDETLPPATVLLGAASPAFLAPLCERVANALGAPVRVVPGGHLAYFTHPGPFARAVLTATEENR